METGARDGVRTRIPGAFQSFAQQRTESILFISIYATDSMVIPLEALRIFAQHRPSTLITMSELLYPLVDDSAVGISCLPDLLSTPLITPRNADGASTLLSTKYGLRLELNDGQYFKISDMSVHSEQLKDLLRKCKNQTKSSTKLPVLEALSSGKMEKVAEEPVLEDHHRYKIFPSWITSYLWSFTRHHDPEIDSDEIPAAEEPILEDHRRYKIWPGWTTSYLWSLTRHHSPEVDSDEIESLYPSWKPFFLSWGDIYESSFEERECHLGTGVEVFKCVRERVTWETEGILIACWLALQPHVEEVQYLPRGEYLLEKGNIEKELHRFLIDMESLLHDEDD